MGNNFFGPTNVSKIYLVNAVLMIHLEERTRNSLNLAFKIKAGEICFLKKSRESHISPMLPVEEKSWFVMYSSDKIHEKLLFHFRYFNDRNFRVQKISRISRMTPQYAKLNGHEKNVLANSRKLIPMRYGFQILLIIFCLLEHKNRLFSLSYSCFVWENPISRKLIPAK